MPLTEEVTLKARLEAGNRVQVPKPLRLRFALDSSQVLRVAVGVLNARVEWEKFYANMDKSGRITIPKLTLNLMQDALSEPSLVGLILEVNIEPA